MHFNFREFVYATLFTALVGFVLYALVDFRSENIWLECFVLLFAFVFFNRLRTSKHDESPDKLIRNELSTAKVLMLIVTLLFSIFIVIVMLYNDDEFDEKVFGFPLIIFNTLLLILIRHTHGIWRDIELGTKRIAFWYKHKIYEIEYWEVSRFELEQNRLIIEVGEHRFDFPLKQLSDAHRNAILNNFNSTREQQIQERTALEKRQLSEVQIVEGSDKALEIGCLGIALVIALFLLYVMLS